MIGALVATSCKAVELDEVAGTAADEVEVAAADELADDDSRAAGADVESCAGARDVVSCAAEVSTVELETCSSTIELSNAVVGAATDSCNVVGTTAEVSLAILVEEGCAVVVKPLISLIPLSTSSSTTASRSGVARAFRLRGIKPLEYSRVSHSPALGPVQ
jgi:hypothetical protein